MRIVMHTARERTEVVQHAVAAPRPPKRRVHTKRTQLTHLHPVSTLPQRLDQRTRQHLPIL